MINIDINIPKTNASEKIIVEAGHIYTNELHGQDQESGVAFGGVISDLFNNLGYNTEKWLFIDDYNPQFANKPIILNEKKYISFLKKHNFSPDKIVHESEMVKVAKGELEFLIKHNFVSEGYNDKKLYLTKGNILLFDPSTDIYSCSLLDACLYKQKLEQSDVCITVLDKKWTKQQQNTKQVVKKMGYNPEKVVGVFYSNNSSYEEKNKTNPLEHVTNTLNLLTMINGMSGKVNFSSSKKFEYSNEIGVEHVAR